MDIAAWLRDLGLERYADAFADNDVDPDVLPKLTAEDLIAIGITSVGHRRKLLEAIADLAEPAPADEVVDAASPTPEPPRRGEAERRQLTVMFVDLVGSTALSARLDPEDMRAVIAAYQSTCSEVARRYQGHIAKFMGDGVLAYFGYPSAHEDDAERAIRAGLEIADAIAKQTADGAALAVRIGISTGQVVVGDLIGEGGAQEEAVVGETPNLAARLQGLAEPGTVVIAPATRRLLGGLFELVDLGAHDLKGFAEPVQAWQVLGESAAEGRFAALHPAGLAPLVGREHELALLLDRFDLAKSGDGQVVLLSGEPGIGKSRIAEILRGRLADEAHVELRYFCSPFHSNSALYPVLEQVQRAAGFARDDPPEARLDKLEALLGQEAQEVSASASLLARAMVIPSGERYPPLNLSPQQQKQRTLEILIEQLEGLAAKQPVLMIFEDAHWIDPSTRELFDLVVERVARLTVLFVVTFRPEFSPPWTGHAHVTRLSLNRLSHGQGTAMIERLTGGRALPGEVLQQILDKTDGVPLFIEELTKTVLESGLLITAGDHFELAGPLPPLAIPSTLQDSLMARLDRLGPVKEVAQIGAVIGRQFSHELLAAVAALPERQLSDALDRLTASELVFRRGAPPDATYTFKHALVQDTAYATLLRSRRQQLHARIVGVLEQGVADAVDQPELLAYHLTEAGLFKQAIPYWHQAGRRAAERSANVEAIAHLRKGLGLIESLPESEARDRQELTLQLDLGPAVMALKGFASSAVGEVFGRARELCARIGEPEQTFAATWNLWLHHQIGAELPEARRMLDDVSAIAERNPTPEFAIESHHAAWTTLFAQGEMAATNDHCGAVMAAYDPEQHHTLSFVYGGHDPGVCARNHRGVALWFLGYPDRGLGISKEAVNLGEQLGHGFSVSLARTYLTLHHFLRREPERVVEEAGKTMASCEEFGPPHFHAIARTMRGWALVAMGQTDDGLAEIKTGFAAFRKSGADLRRSYYEVFLADAYRMLGRPETALNALQDALASIKKNDEGTFEAEVHRLKGMVLAAQLDADRAEACFEQALGLARAHSLRSVELRTATNLAHLWGDQGRRGKARDLLAPVYSWFTEGFDTADLKDAKALLDELA